MSLLSYYELCELIEQGVIQNTSFDNVNSASIDLTLGENIMYETSATGMCVSMLEKNPKHLISHTIRDEYHIQPGEFILAQTKEVFNLPNNISAEYKLKSTMARNGLDHLNAGWADAGWNGSVLTLEFKNCLRRNSIVIRPGMKCGQMVFFRHAEVPADRSYANRGQYNGDKSVSAGKGLK